MKSDKNTVMYQLPIANNENTAQLRFANWPEKGGCCLSGKEDMIAY